MVLMGGARIGALASAAVLALSASAADAHTRVAEDRQADLGELLGENFELTPEGLYRVALPNGGSILTHGPDPRGAMNQLDLDGIFPGGLQTRPPICASDYYQHVLYGRLAGTPDLSAIHVPVIRQAMGQLNAVLATDSVASGGVTADYKVLCDESGQMRVDSFTAPSTSFADIVAAAKVAGFNDPRADYTIFFDGLVTACGIASYTIDSSLSVDNRSNRGGGYAVSYQGCWLDETPMHENAHVQGAVQPESPNSTGSGGHCYEERDVLCYSPDGGDRNQGGVISRCSGRVTFDCGNDDYFDSAPEADEYLASHWNLGSALNRFVAFGQGAPLGSSSAGGGEQVDPPCPRQSCAVPISDDGSERTGLAAERGGWSLYSVRVAKGLKRLEFVMRARNCDPAAGCRSNLDLYARSRRPPSERKYDCSSRKRGSNEKCRVRRPRGGKFYVGVRTVSAPPGTSFAIRTVTRGPGGR